MANEPDNLVLEMLRRLDAKIDLMGGDLAAVKLDVGSVKTDMRTHTRTVDILSKDVRMIRAAVNDIAKADATAPQPLWRDEGQP